MSSWSLARVYWLRGNGLLFSDWPILVPVFFFFFGRVVEKEGLVIFHVFISTCCDKHGAERWRTQTSCQVERRVSSKGAGINVGLQLCDERARHFEQVFSDGKVEGAVSTLLLWGIDLGSALHQQTEAALTIPPHRQVKWVETMEVGSVDQVGVAFCQVSKQWAERCAVSSQSRQVEWAAPVPVYNAGVRPCPQQHLHHLHLSCDDGKVERCLLEVVGHVEDVLLLAAKQSVNELLNHTCLLVDDSQVQRSVSIAVLDATEVSLDSQENTGVPSAAVLQQGGGGLSGAVRRSVVKRCSYLTELLPERGTCRLSVTRVLGNICLRGGA